MDWKKKAEEMKAHAAEAAKKTDKDDEAVDAATAKAKEAAAAAKAKMADLKARLDKDGDGSPDAVPNLSEAQRKAIEEAKAKAKAAQEKLGKKPAENA